MKDPYFFGYGSLVNRATHDYPRAARAEVAGWRRCWTHTRLRKVAYLSVVPSPDTRIEGLIAAVPGHDWAALDERERAYARHPVRDGLRHEADHEVEVQIYAVEPAHADHPDARHPILLSYIDVVLQGYLREFGEAGAKRFVDTTDGWEAPILDDRAAPIYPRHQRLTGEERAYVDRALKALGADIFKRD